MGAIWTRRTNHPLQEENDTILTRKGGFRHSVCAVGEWESETYEKASEMLYDVKLIGYL